MPFIPVEMRIDERWLDNGYFETYFLWKSDIETLKKCMADTLILVCLSLYRHETKSTEITYEKLTKYLRDNYGNIKMYYVINDNYEYFVTKDDIEIIQARYLKYLENSREIENFDIYKHTCD